MNELVIKNGVIVKGGQSIFTGSMIVSNNVVADSFTGSLQGTASWAITASYVNLSDYLTTTYFNSVVSSSTSRWYGTASNSLTSSYSINANQLDGNHGNFYQTASNLLYGYIPLERLTGSYSITASWATNADQLDGNHGNFYQTASNLLSGYVPTGRLTGSYSITASWAYGIISTADITVNEITASAAKIDGVVIKNNTLDAAGSNILAGSLNVGGTLTIDDLGNINTPGNITASNFRGTASNAYMADTASYLYGKALLTDTLLFNSDNSYNIGSVADNRPNTIYIGTNLISPKVTTPTLSSSIITLQTNRVIYSNALSGIFLGTGTGQSAFEGNYPVMIGYGAGQNAGSVANTIFIGTSAGQNATFSENSTVIGAFAGMSLGPSTKVTALGYSAGSLAKTASNATFIGPDVDVVNDLIDASNSTAIGSGARIAISNSIILGGTGSTARNVGIGTFTPGYTLHVVGNIGATSITSSLYGTSSYAYTASFAKTASYVNASSIVGTVSSASVALTASYVSWAVISGSVETASYAFNANQLDGNHGAFYQTASNLLSGYIPTGRLTGSYSITASWATNSDQLDGNHGNFYQTASNLLYGYVPTGRLTGSYTITASRATTASYAISADQLDGNHGNFYQTASNLLSGYVPTGRLTGSYTITASQAITASYALTSITASTLINKVMVEVITPASGATTTIDQQPTGSYKSAFYNYVLYQDLNSRCGIFFTTWTNANITYAEHTTTDIGDTEAVTLAASIESDGTVKVVANLSTPGTWTIKAEGTYL